MGDRIEKLRLIGADFAAISANTPHLLWNEICACTSLPLISITESVKEEAVGMGIKKAGLIGTRFTMQSDFYTRSFAAKGMEIIVPETNEIDAIHEKLFSELEIGIFRDETRELMLEIIQKMIHRSGIDSLILGCTEFPLLFTESSYLGIPFLNTTDIHVKAIVNYCLTK